MKNEAGLEIEHAPKEQCPKKCILITGASSEIGMAIAEKYFHWTNCHIILQCFKKEEKLKQWISDKAEVCNHNDITTNIVAIDLQNEEQLSELCLLAAKVDILINAAAITKTDLLPMLAFEDIQAMIQVNIMALTKICQSAIGYMMRKRQGIIINISSISAQKTNRGQSVYAGTKAYMESFSKGIAAEFGQRGVRCNCIAPGAIEAGNLKALLSMASEEIKSNICSSRLGSPEDVANVCEWLAKPESSFINGECIKVDGGFLKGI